MKNIKLVNGGHVVVDRSEYGHLNKFKWRVDKRGYVVRQDRLRKSKTPFFTMHRQIMGFPDGLLVDHINQDKLDNRIKNLRVCLKMENSQNRLGWCGKTTSQYKGVFLDKRAQKMGYLKTWQASIGYNRRRISLGIYKTSKEAALAYNKAARKYHGEFALLNDLSLSK